MARSHEEALRPTGMLLTAQIAVAAAIEQRAVAATSLDNTTSDLLLRIALSPDGHLRAVDLSHQLQLSPSHVSRQVDRAIEEGLVERRADPNDRRARIIELTPAGQTALDDFIPRLLEVLHEVVFRTLEPKEIETLVSLLGRIEAAATEAIKADTTTRTLQE